MGILGQPDGGAVIDHGLAGLLAYPFSPRFSGFVELTGLFAPASDSQALLTTLGLEYAAMPSLVLDLVVMHIRSGGDDNTLVTLGLIKNFGS